MPVTGPVASPLTWCAGLGAGRPLPKRAGCPFRIPGDLPVVTGCPLQSCRPAVLQYGMLYNGENPAHPAN